MRFPGWQYCVLCNLSIFYPCITFQDSQFSHSVVSDSLQPHEPQHARPPCPSPAPGVHPNPCPLSQWCHPTISCSVVPFPSCPQFFPASGSFQISQLFASGGQSIGVSASVSVLSKNTQDCSPLGWTGWISLQSKGLSRVSSNDSTLRLIWPGSFPCDTLYNCEYNRLQWALWVLLANYQTWEWFWETTNLQLVSEVSLKTVSSNLAAWLTPGGEHKPVWTVGRGGKVYQINF